MRQAWTWGLGLLVLAGPVQADFDEVKARGVLRVVTFRDVPEFFYLDRGRPAGFDVDLLEGFGGLHKIRVEWLVQDSVAQVIPSLLEGKGDMVGGGLTVTEPRQRQIDFSVETFPTRFVVVTRRPRARVTTLEQLRRERVGTVKGAGYSHAVAAAGIPAAHIDDRLGFGDFAEALRTGRVTAVVWAVEDVFRAQKHDDALETGMFLGAAGSLAFGVRKGDARLKQALDEYVTHIRRSGAWSRLVVKHYGEAAPAILKTIRAEAP